MAVTIAAFKVAFPEFTRAGDPMLEAQLALVELEVSDSFGDSRDLAVMLRLADTLALSPWGRDARMIPKGVDNAFSSTYGLRFQRMAEANGVSASRLGSQSGGSSDGCA
ncbi:MAG TPA: hypothetical protein VIU86_19965 [Gaiellaceae bacterium]